MKNVQDIYRLSPMQQGMLFHTLYSPGGGAYVEQVYWRWRGPLRAQALRSAWQQVVDRHPVLRTAFFWEGLPEPMQAVRHKAEMPWEEVDWQGVGGAGQEAAFKVLAEQHRQGISLSAAPLMRFTVARLGPELYQCLWSYHHLLLDAWSVPLCLREVFLYYEAQLRGQQLELPLPPPYRHFIAWLARQDHEAALRYWRKVLAGFSAPTPLVVESPAWQAPAGVISYGSRSARLGATTSERLAALARQHQLTLGILVQGAWAVLCSRYSGEQEVAFGTVVSGRPPSLPGVEGMVGLFINNVVIRQRVPPAARLLPWLKQLQEQQVAALSHDYLSLVELQSCSEVPRGQPLFNSMVVVENTPNQQLSPELGGRLPVEGFARTEARTGYPLTLLLHLGSELDVQLIYDESRMDAALVERMVGHLHTLLESFPSSPHQPLGSLPLLGEAERRRVLVEWNDTRIDFPSEATIHGLFSQQALHSPHAVAVIADDQSLTYAQLEQRANQVAHLLQRHGVGPETPVAICLERSAELIVSLLAILKAGGAYVPLDVSYPAQRLSLMLEDSQPRLLITTRALAQRLPAASHLPLVCVEEVDFTGLPSPPPSGASARNLAYILFTSGSTGRPKGVAVDHRAVLRLVINSNYVLFSSDDCIAQVSNTSFDAATFEVWGALLHGARLVIISREVLLSPPHFVESLRSERVTSIFLTTALFNQIARQIPGAFSTLRDVLVGGDACDPNAMRSVLQQDPPTRLLNAYGPTESTTFAVWHLVLSVPEGATTVPIGRPLSNTTAYVLDSQLQPVPPGVPGELYLGGEGLARGYVGRPESTAERFVPHPFSSDPGERLYRTGDKVRWLLDGTIEFLGRFDSQVKLRGFRIELGEVEAALHERPEVGEALVLLREDTPGDKRLVAYVTPRSPQPLGAGALREALKQKLPEYMVPSAFMILETLPLTPNGKVDRRALPSPDSAHANSRPFAAPRNRLEQELATLWAELLGVQRVGIHDNFFELGGHSLLAVRLAARLQRTLDRELALSNLFQHPTVAQLAEVLRSQQGEIQPRSTLLRLQAGEASTRPLFLVHGGGGSALAYLELVRHLRPSQPMYAFHALGIDGGEPQYTSVEELACGYLTQMREVQPAGPYLLGGWSFGGVVAFEMARQLHASSEAVKLLALIDSPAPTGTLREQGELGELRLLAGLSWMMGVSWEQMNLNIEHLRRLGRRERLAWLLEQTRRSPAGAPDITLEQLERMLLLLDHHQRALWHYTPGPYEGSAVFFTAHTHLDLQMSEAPQQWRRWLTRGLTVHELPGDHYSLLRKPHVATLGQWLMQLLGTSEQRESAV